MSPPTTYLSYDYENRVVGITYPSTATNSFSYNGNDLRIKKVDSSGTRNYITDGDSPAAPVLSDGLATFTLGLSERRSGTSAFYHGDALGSTRDITNSSQSVTDTRRYDAFGMSISPTGSNPTPFGFVGGSQYQTDADSGLMLLGHRYYDSSIGRFISKDPAQAGTNWYAYCRNRPLSRTDRSGLEEEEPGEVPLLGRPGSLGGMGGAGGGEGVGAVDEPVPEAAPVDGAVIAEAGGAGGAAGGDAGGSLGREVGGGGPELEPVKAGNKFPWHRPTPKNPYPRSDIREGRSAIGTYDGDGYLVGRTDRFSRSGRADHPMPHGQPARWEPNARNPAGNGQWGPHMIDEEEYLQLIIEALE